MAESKPMIVAGVMSGTSADGIDVAMVKIEPRRVSGARRGGANAPGLQITLQAHRAFPFPRALRSAILAAMNATATATAELARLNWRLGIAYAEAVRQAMDSTQIRPALIGCHGQTLYHQGVAAPYAGRRFACTWQAGEPALLAAECGIPVVSNFRPADMAAGGQGAPLVPLFDYAYFAHPTRARVLLNIGGIANLTVIPAGAGPEKVIAFDTGPGNMVIDALMQKLYGKPYDKGGRVAARGRILDEVVLPVLREKYFIQAPPKSGGREQFGAEYAERFLAACSKVSKKPEDAITSATALTVISIWHAYHRWADALTGDAETELVASGGGAHNPFLLARLSEQLARCGCTVTTTDALGLPAEAKEAAAFALLAYQTWHHRPGNVSQATGAARPAILGQITYV
ncbi:MAG TPA: anhydro-N-acetylmuramic acid kinase [Acidobacteriaceae bacterium]